MICCSRIRMSGDEDDMSTSKTQRSKKDKLEVDAEVEKAMKEMSDAMREMKLRKKEAKKNKAGQGNQKATGEPGIHLVHTTGKAKYSININSANNIQVGNKNFMFIQKGRKAAPEPEGVQVSSSESEEEEEEEEERPREKPPEEMTPEERRVYDTLNSTARARLEDTGVALENVGKDYRRFLRYLGLTDQSIEHLELDYKGEGVREVLHQGLLQWTRSENPTIGCLAQALKKLGKEDAVWEMSNKTTESDLA